MLSTIWQAIQERVTTTQLARFGLSLVLALFLWGWVTVREDPVETQRYAEIVITAPELPGTAQIVTSLPRANVSITDVSSALDRITRSDIAVTLDTSPVDGPGSYELDVIVNTTRSVRDIRVSPDAVRVEVEDVVSRNFPLAIESQMLTDDARRIADVRPEVSEVTVTGTESNVNRIDRVVLPVTVQNQTTSFVEMIEPYAVDDGSQRIQEVSILPAHVRTEVQLERSGKTVSVVPQISGAPAEGFVVQQQVAIPATVVVDGPAELLDEMLFVYTEPVDISGATRSLSENVELEPLPEGVTLVEPAVGELEVRVSIAATGGQSNMVPDMAIEVVGLREGLTATVDPESVDVSISAPPESLNALQASDIAAVVDVAGLGPGVYTLDPEVVVPENVTVTRLEPDRVVVIISGPGGSPPPGATPGTPITMVNSRP